MQEDLKTISGVVSLNRVQLRAFRGAQKDWEKERKLLLSKIDKLENQVRKLANEQANHVCGQSGGPVVPKLAKMTDHSAGRVLTLLD